MLPLMSSPNRMFGGNPVAVVFDADGLSASQMQAIAVEFNYSETTFVLRASQPDHAAWVRIFTPSREIPFAGHPNVGTAFALAALMGERGETIPDHFVFEEEAGLVPVSLIRENGAVGKSMCSTPNPASASTIIGANVDQGVGRTVLQIMAVLERHDLRHLSRPRQLCCRHVRNADAANLAFPLKVRRAAPKSRSEARAQAVWRRGSSARFGVQGGDRIQRVALFPSGCFSLYLRRRGTDGLSTHRWRGVDSNFRFRDALSSPTARPWSRRLIRR